MACPLNSAHSERFDHE